MSVAGQQGVRSVLLDQDTSQVGTITVDGQTYEVYRHDNLLEYASGISISTNGQRVTSASTARTVLSALAHRRAVEKLGMSEARTLRASNRNVSETVQTVSEAAVATNETLEYVMGLKDERVDGTTAWNATVDEAPSVVAFNQTARELTPRLQAFQAEADAYTSNASALATLLEKRANGTSVDSQRLYQQYAITVQARDALDDRFGYDGIDGLTDNARLSEAIAENATAVPEYGSTISRRFATVHNRTVLAANSTEALELPGAQFLEAQNTAQELESTWMDQWQKRQNAPMDVYKTIGGVSVVIIGAAGYVHWKRR